MIGLSMLQLRLPTDGSLRVAVRRATEPTRAQPVGDGAISSGTPDATPVREGDVLAGKFRIDKVRRGGMGVVVAAHHIHLDEKVAIKFLLPETLGKKEAARRFAREAKAAVKIKSEHAARVSDVGTLENGAPYMVMEYLEGGDLANGLERRGEGGVTLFFRALRRGASGKVAGRRINTRRAGDRRSGRGSDDVG